MAAIGASRALPSVPTKVRLLNRLPTLDLGGGDYSSCPTPAIPPPDPRVSIGWISAVPEAVIYYRPLRSPCPRADAARVGIQRDVPVKIRWHLVMLGSDRLKRADTGPDTTIRMRSENRDFRQLHCLETVSPRRAGELRDRGLHEPVSAGPHWIRICGKHASRQKCCTQDQGLTNNRHMTSSPSSVSIGKSSGGNGAVRLGNV